MQDLRPETDAALIAAARTYFAERRARVPAFARRRFGLIGTLKLHRHALGWDILKAPVNVMLSPVLILSRLGAWAAGRAGAVPLAAWLGTRRILMPTAVATATERAIVVDLLELPWTGPGKPSDANALAAAMLAQPTLGGLIRQRAAASEQTARALSDYGGTRSAVAEMTTALGTIGAGALAFNTLTPGMVSLAPTLAALLAHQAAVASFPLGAMLGTAWYGVFPTAASPWLLVGITASMMGLGALVAAFAGVIADPIQTALGLHQRRLNRLIDTMEDSFTGSGRRAFAAREHYLARLLDLSDAGLAALRMLRG
jgi:hypothetical protein